VTDRGIDASDSLIPRAFAGRIQSYFPDAAQAWLTELPELIASCAARWDLTLLPAFEPGGDASWTAPAKLSTGEMAVLQITVPMNVTHDHVTALQAWNGRGAVRLFAHDARMLAALMELCVPGTDAADLSEADADDVAVEVLPQLWAASIPSSDALGTLAANAAGRAQLMEERAVRFGDVVDSGPFREAARLFISLPNSGNAVLVHGDFHRRNVLLSQRGWLAIDPSSMTGDPAFDVAEFLMHDAHLPSTRSRVDALADRLGLERDRTRAWLCALATQAGSWFLSEGDEVMHDAYIRTASTLL
jgi:streptomycin 6-kinase